MLHRARQDLPHLPDAYSAGVYLQTGMRFYIDVGCHPEVATAETTSPDELVAHVRAGDRLVERLGAALPERQPCCLRTNVDYSGSGNGWGCHESYMHWADPRTLPPDLIPHLVTRLIFTGAGGFDNRSAGIEFMLSPRVRHLAATVSDGSSVDRGIVHTKDEALCGDGSHRLHLICGDTLCSERALWLRAGTTALILRLCEAGRRPGADVALSEPLLALRRLAFDPTCRVVVSGADGRPHTAIAIQRHYLRLVEAHADADDMPAWTAAVCREWRRVLDELEADPRQGALSLDWAIKLALFRQHAEKRGLPWDTLPAWNHVVRRLSAARWPTGHGRRSFRIDEVLGRDGPADAELVRLAPFMRRHALHRADLGLFLALRMELLEIDMRFGQLGPAGLFESLDAARVLRHRMVDPDAIEQAMRHPPAIGRPRVRGELVRRYSGQGDRFLASWDYVVDTATRRVVSLRDPFAPRVRWTAADRAPALPLFERPAMLARLMRGVGLGSTPRRWADRPGRRYFR